MRREVALEERLHPAAERYDAPLGPAPERATFAVDGEPVVLPVELRALERGELRDAEARVEKRPDDEPLEMRRAGVRELVRLVTGQRLALVLVGPHVRLRQGSGQLGRFRVWGYLRTLENRGARTPTGPLFGCVRTAATGDQKPAAGVTLAVSRARKLKRSGSCRASAPALCSAQNWPPTRTGAHPGGAPSASCPGDSRRPCRDAARPLRPQGHGGAGTQRDPRIPAALCDTSLPLLGQLF